MSNLNLSDLIIDGLGSSNGGTFNLVKINGHGTITSDLNCQTFTCNGIGKIDGELDASTTTMNGILTILGDVKGNNMKLSGKIDISGSLLGDQIHIDGDFAAKENCIVDHFKGRGRISLKHLNARIIDFNIFGHCKTNEIKGDEIHIKKGHKKINIFNHTFDPLKTRLSTDYVEGETIYLEHTHAKIVKGKDITIGPGCKIDQLEYEKTFTKQPDDSIVSKVSKI